MLAIQQAPRMGSSQPDSEPLLPFGYAVDPSHDLFDAPPDPAPGAPLLSETDSKFLSSFFEDMTANQYDMPSFGEGLNFSDAWLDLPPQFMGTATSFGSHSSLDSTTDHSFSPSTTNGASDKQLHLQRMMPDSHLMPPPPPPPNQPHIYAQQHSDEVLNAAATLLQNGSNSRTVSHKSCDYSHTRRSVGYPVGHLRHQPMEEFKEENRRSSLGTENDSNYSAWVWGTKERTPQRKTTLPDFQWGSDSSFGPAQGYAPEASNESLDCLQKTHLKCLECLEVSNSATNTRPSSPNNNGSFDNDGDDSIYVKTEDDLSGPPRKRRKSKNFRDAGDEEDDDDLAAARSGRKRKPRSERVDTSPASDTPTSGRRRKSVASGSKVPRENLTEEQKRENHIRSEQKRRTLIKEGFDDLGELVPGLKGGGFSKSTTLAMAAEWLEELLRDNKALSAQLAALNGR
ncbi:hypothetical protein CDD81_3289 [Ophiocordyceps australis]|uniref:BHLH domain-containing protein n=1 Tax=Ophiocordyceps australis TaxID=1399860 RepID=A0A2C5XJT6_9HYPO|nr:hypothetical protein CDD81_3289 [Ophiocordyceps australis]